jgi:predicted permease
MQNIAFVLCCLACACDGRRVQTASVQLESSIQPEHSNASAQDVVGEAASLANTLFSSLGASRPSVPSAISQNPSATATQSATTDTAARPEIYGWDNIINPPLRPTAADERAPPSTMLSSSAEQTLTLLAVMGIGKSLSGRFPGKEAGVIQKLLLQFLVPATLFKGLASQTVQLSQMSFVAAGCVMVLARMACGWIASRAVLGGSVDPALRRTAFFQISTMASALSVLPFVSEFLGAEYVGLGGLVDLPMKMYMLVFMPLLLKAMGEEATEGSSEGSGGAKKVVSKLLSDPITLSLILGLATGAATGGQGLKALGFVGKAINSLAGAQTAVLFLLIGLKLKFDSATPLYSVITLLATQGALLMAASLAILVLSPSEAMKQFIILFAQGAPSVVGLGVITAAANSGIKGYNTDFAFDIVGLAFPISALLQCFAGLLGASYAPVSGLMGAGLVAVAAVGRFVFKDKFNGTPAASTQ